MAIDRESRRNLVKGIVSAAKIEQNAENSDEERLKARRKRKLYNEILARLRAGQTTDSNQ